MARYQFGDQVLDKENEYFADALQSAYQSKQRPLCLCQPGGIEMYIAKLAGSSEYLLKRMPNSGHSHHPDCESFEIPSELSGRGAVENSAISEDSSTGITKLKLDFSLSKTSVTRSTVKAESVESSSIKANPKKLSLQSVLHCLYEDAGLNKWSPKMKGKRKWFVIRKHLLKAANNKTVRNNPLTDILIIPENYYDSDAAAITARFRSQLSKFKTKGNKNPLGLLIGEVRKFDKAKYGKQVYIKHLPFQSFYFSDELDKRISKRFRDEIDMHQTNTEMHLMVIATFTVSSVGNPSIETMSLMMVDSNWIPFDNLEELDLINKTVYDSRYFIKSLRYNKKSTDVNASILLTDTAQPTALYIIPHDASEQYRSDLSFIVENSELDSTIWDLKEGCALSLPDKRSNTEKSNIVQTSTQNYPPSNEAEQVPPSYLTEIPDEYM